MSGDLLFSRIEQVGIVVRDLDKAIKRYESLNIGPFRQHKSTYLSRELWGKPVPSDAVLARLAHADAGPLEVELIQPVAESSHWMQFLKTKGEGVHHFGFFVEDVEMEKAKLVENEFRIVYESTYRRADGFVGHAIYFDISEVGDILFEVMLRPPK